MILTHEHVVEAGWPLPLPFRVCASGTLSGAQPLDGLVDASIGRWHATDTLWDDPVFGVELGRFPWTDDHHIVGDNVARFIPDVHRHDDFCGAEADRGDAENARRVNGAGWRGVIRCVTDAVLLITDPQMHDEVTCEARVVLVRLGKSGVATCVRLQHRPQLRAFGQLDADLTLVGLRLQVDHIYPFVLGWCGCTLVYLTIFAEYCQTIVYSRSETLNKKEPLSRFFVIAKSWSG